MPPVRISISAVITPPGKFEFQGVPPGHYELEGSAGPSRLSLRNAMLNNRDVLDAGLDVPAFGVVTGISLVFSADITRVSGRVAGAPAVASGALYVVIFPVEEIYWSAESRRVRAVAPNDEGGFTFEGLPPGDYKIAAFGQAANPSWSDPAFLRQLSPTASSVSVREGTPTTVNVIAR